MQHAINYKGIQLPQCRSLQPLQQSPHIHLSWRAYSGDGSWTSLSPKPKNHQFNQIWFLREKQNWVCEKKAYGISKIGNWVRKSVFCCCSAYLLFWRRRCYRWRKVGNSRKRTSLPWRAQWNPNAWNWRRRRSIQGWGLVKFWRSCWHKPTYSTPAHLLHSLILNLSSTLGFYSPAECLDITISPHEFFFFAFPEKQK